MFIITDFGCGKGKLKRCLEAGMCEVPVFNLHVNIDSYCHIKVVLTWKDSGFGCLPFLDLHSQATEPTMLV